MRNILSFFLLACLFSCSPAHTFKKDKTLFDASPVQLSFKSVADMNDSYFVIRDNYFFEFYRVLFDSIRNSSYKGKYSTFGDTMLLHFYNTKGKTLLGSKAVVSPDKKEIRFFH